jgi:hypothetical protein
MYFKMLQWGEKNISYNIHILICILKCSNGEKKIQNFLKILNLFSYFKNLRFAVSISDFFKSFEFRFTISYFFGLFRKFRTEILLFLLPKNAYFKQKSDQKNANFYPIGT